MEPNGGSGRRGGGVWEGQTLLFVHLPKTGGTSIREAFRREYGEEERQEVYGGELRLAAPDLEFARRVGRRLEHLRVVYGHFSYGVHEFLGAEPRYGAFLRDPVKRVMSLYRHFGREPGLPFHDRIAGGMGLGEWVASGATEMTNNHACRVLSGTPPTAGRMETDRAMLQRAIGNVERDFVFLGALDRFEEGVRRLAGLLGWRSAAAPRLNVAPAGEAEATEVDFGIVREHNALDLELWDWACERNG